MINNKSPIDAVIAITYKCNARCSICDIWKKNEERTIMSSAYLKLPKNLRYINVSGGEPFLDRQIVKIIKILKKHCPRAKITISTNGLAKKIIIDRAKKIQKIDKNIGLAVSLDGTTKKYDIIRGVPGAGKKSLETIRTLKAIGWKNLKIAFTLNPKNASKLTRAYKLSKKLGVGFTMTTVQSSNFYFGQRDIKFQNTEKIKKQFQLIIADLLKSISPKTWLRAYYFWALYQLIETGRAPLRSQAGIAHFFLDPFGNIYPSVVHNVCLGNLAQHNFQELWQSKVAQKFRQDNEGQPNNNWMVCTARTPMKKHPFKVINQILKLQATRIMSRPSKNWEYSP